MTDHAERYVIALHNMSPGFTYTDSSMLNMFMVIAVNASIDEMGERTDETSSTMVTLIEINRAGQVRCYGNVPASMIFHTTDLIIYDPVLDWSDT